MEGTVIAAIKRYFRQPFLLLQITAALEQRRLEAPERAQHTEKERERLEGKRKRVVDMRAEDQITREDCATRLQAIDQELAKLPADPRPAEVDSVMLAKRIMTSFLSFDRMPFEQQRILLQRAVREIIVTAGTIPAITLRGGFLGDVMILDWNTSDVMRLNWEGVANLLPPSIPQPWPQGKTR